MYENSFDANLHRNVDSLDAKTMQLLTRKYLKLHQSIKRSFTTLESSALNRLQKFYKDVKKYSLINYIFFDVPGANK